MRNSRLARRITGLLLSMLGAVAAASELPHVGSEAILLDGFEDNGTRGWSMTVPPTCTDGNTSGNETDVDCGGPDCADCANGQLCDGDADCLSGHCFMQTCVECLAANDCPPTGNECTLPACISLTCGTVNVPFGTALASQTPGDCQLFVCDGNGGTSSIADNADIPDDGNQCTLDLCVAGTPSFIDLPDGTPCPSGTCLGGVCLPL